MRFSAFKCTYPRCEKFFNRHDNLLQHLKVHREPIFKQTSSSSPPSPTRVDYPHHVYQAVAVAATNPHPFPLNPDPRPHESQPRTIYSHLASASIPMQYNQYPPLPGPHVPHPAPALTYSTSAEAMTLLTNVAVSSLRTEVSSLRTELPSSPNVV